jgi:Stage II sporulation protein E (SpoIIE)
MIEREQIEFETGALAMLERLLRRTHLSGAADLATIVAEEARAVGADGLVLYLVDYEQTTLVPVPAPDAEGREPLSVLGTLAGRAYTSTSIVGGEGEGGLGRRLWFPLLDGTDRVGAMEVAFPGAAPPPDALVTVCERYAHLVAMLVVSKGAYSDFFELVRRREQMTGAAELLASITPPRVLGTRDFVLGALLEPAYDMGGDAFDYAYNGDTLHFAVFDAMGHGLAAAGVAAFALSMYRNSRRGRLGLTESYAAIDAAIAEQYPDSRFVTAVLAELEVSSGRLRWISAGHPAPLLLRGGRLVKTLDVTPSPPVGMQLAIGTPVVAQDSLEPGDMVLLYTDGLTEARRPDGELFTVERLGEFIEREAASGHAAPETLRRLREAVIGRGEGTLRDDATALLVEWRRGSDRALVPETV